MKRATSLIFSLLDALNDVKFTGLFGFIEVALAGKDFPVFVEDLRFGNKTNEFFFGVQHR